MTAVGLAIRAKGWTQHGSARVPRAGVYPVIVLLIALWIAVVRNDVYLSTVATTAALYAIAAIGLNLVFGYAGDLSLGQGAFYALGVYGTVLAGNHWDVAYPIAALAGVALATAGSAVVGVAALRARGLYLAMITVAAGLVVYSIAQGWIAVTGGPEGLRVMHPLTIGGRTLSPQRLLMLAAVVLAVVVWVSANLVRNHWGRAWKATQASRIAADASGLGTYRSRLAAFTLAGFLAGLAGAIYPLQTGYITSDPFSLDYSVFVLLVVLVGGAGTVVGPIVGASLLVAFLEIYGTSLGALTNLIYGALFIVVVYVAPSGLVGAASSMWQKVAGRWLAGRFEATAPFDGGQATFAPLEPAPAGTALLEVTDVSKEFFGVRALDGVGLRVTPSTVHGLIGANGSGKSTLLNVIMGIYSCDSGEVTFRGEAIQNKSSYRIARRGIARTFQTSELFTGLTVRENVMAAAASLRADGLFSHAIRTPGARRREKAAYAQARGLLHLVGLSNRESARVEDLAPGQGRLLEVARALATSPSLIVLDEPAAGLDGHEVATLAETLDAVRRSGVTVLIVEHRMELIAALADEVTVLERGRAIAHDTPEAIQDNEAVIASYLGDIKLVV